MYSHCDMHLISQCDLQRGRHPWVHPRVGMLDESLRLGQKHQTVTIGGKGGASVQGAPD